MIINLQIFFQFNQDNRIKSRFRQKKPAFLEAGRVFLFFDINILTTTSMNCRNNNDHHNKYGDGNNII